MDNQYNNINGSNVEDDNEKKYIKLPENLNYFDGPYKRDPVESQNNYNSLSTFEYENGYLVRYIFFDKDYNITRDSNKAVYCRKCQNHSQQRANRR